MKNLPSKTDILTWISDNPSQASKRDIARAFGLKGAAKIELKHLLRELQADGALARGARRTYTPPGTLPPVMVLKVLAPDADGDLSAIPLDWTGQGACPHFTIISRRDDPALGAGDRILARITATDDGGQARIIRKIGTGPAKVVGIYQDSAEGGRIIPVDKKATSEWGVAPGDRNGAREGELVEAEQMGRVSGRMGLPKARILARIGDPSAAKSVSLIAIHEHGLRDHFPDDVAQEAQSATAAPLAEREDLRKLPLITIDPADARDHDDAICAFPDDDAENPGGHILWVAIADVAYYVTPGSALDEEARARGNSTYFPDRVVPMLPDKLSGDLCSLHDGVDRPCLAVEIKLAADGSKLSHRFTRGLMQCPAALSYEQAQAGMDGTPDPVTAPLVEPVLRPLWAAWSALMQARTQREPLDLDLPERRIELSETGEVTSVAFKPRLDAHKVVEEAMILANVCAAETLQAKRQTFVYRVHEPPNPDKVEALRATVESAGLTLPKGQMLKPRQLNTILNGAAGTDMAEMLNMSILRSMSQAYYSVENFGHFGLNLARYAHFTSPIRRYADLIVHRALIAAHTWGRDGQTVEEAGALEETAEQISQTERRSMIAERDTTDRYLAAYMKDRIGSEFAGKVSGVARFGLFVKLEETGADGLIPISHLGREYFRHDPETQTLTGEQSRKVIGLGMPVTVRLAEAVPVTGGLLFELLSFDGKSMPAPPKKRGKGPVNRLQRKSRIKRSRDVKRANRK